MTGTQGVVQSGLLVGRDAEQSLIADRVAEREAGTAILVRGPAGIGKTALVEEAVRRAGSSRRILRTFGNAPETGLPMAGLYQLLQPLLPLAHLIPEPRQAALRVAFGITVGPPPEPFALAMATLDLLADAAAEQPLLVVAEDVQWLDPATVGGRSRSVAATSPPRGTRPSPASSSSPRRAMSRSAGAAGPASATPA